MAKNPPSDLSPSKDGDDDRTIGQFTASHSHSDGTTTQHLDDDATLVETPLVPAGETSESVFGGQPGSHGRTAQDDQTIAQSLGDERHAAGDDATLAETTFAPAQSSASGPGPAFGSGPGSGFGSGVASDATLMDAAGPLRSPSAGDDATLVSGAEDIDATDFQFQARPPTGSGESNSDATLDSGGAPRQRDTYQGTVLITPSTSEEVSTKAFDAKSAPPKGFEHRISRFLITQTLGQGTFGSVYLARDPQLDRDVAIKVAKTGVLADNSEIDRFLREAKAAARLRHPNIVPVHEAGSDGPTHFIAYEFVRGKTMKRLLAEAVKLDPATTARTMVPIAQALHYAHQQGIIHRDMKPENVMVTPQGVPHVLDFGLARASDMDTTRTREGAMMGSPAYMSPEQASGRSHLADARADVWSLGVMLYEMLTGERPFRGNITEILIAVKEHPHRPLRSVNPQIDRDLATICEKCLRKIPEERYQTAGELADELERWQRGEPIVARPIGLLDRTWRWACRNPQVAGLLATVVCSLALGVTLSTSFALEAQRKSAQLVTEQNNRVLTQVQSLLTVNSPSYSFLLDSLVPFVTTVVPQLEAKLVDTSLSSTERSRVIAALARLAPQHPSRPVWQAELANALPRVAPGELLALRGYLDPGIPAVMEYLQRLIQSDEANREEQFLASAIMAELNPLWDEWTPLIPDIVSQFLARDALELPVWIEAFRPLAGKLEDSLQTKFRDSDQEAERIAAAAVMAELYHPQVALIRDLALSADSSQFPYVARRFDEHRLTLAAEFEQFAQQSLPEGLSVPAADEFRRRQGNAVLSLFALGLPQKAFPWLALSADPRVRAHVIHEAGPAGLEPEFLAQGWQSAQPDVVSALLICAGHFGTEVLLESQRRKLVPAVTALYRDHPDSGVHASAAWLLQRWDFGEALATAQQDLAVVTASDERWSRAEHRHWLRTAEGPAGAARHWLVLHPDQPVTVGSPDSEPFRTDFEHRYAVDIPRSFAISTTEVTIADFLQFQPEQLIDRQYGPTDDCPANSVSWYDAVKYCRWLSEQAGIPEDQMCYPPVAEVGRRMVLPDDYLARSGYRLPTAHEWEYAARAMADTSRPFGYRAELLPEYAWFDANAGDVSHPVQQLMPNGYGLFDMLGNVLEWTDSWYFDNPTKQLPVSSRPGVLLDGKAANRGQFREIRGGSYTSPETLVRLADRDHEIEMTGSLVIGFRLARTIPGSARVIVPAVESVPPAESITQPADRSSPPIDPAASSSGSSPANAPDGPQ